MPSGLVRAAIGLWPREWMIRCPMHVPVAAVSRTIQPIGWIKIIQCSRAWTDLLTDDDYAEMGYGTAWLFPDELKHTRESFLRVWHIRWINC